MKVLTEIHTLIDKKSDETNLKPALSPSARWQYFVTIVDIQTLVELFVSTVILQYVHIGSKNNCYKYFTVDTQTSIIVLKRLYICYISNR